MNGWVLLAPAGLIALAALAVPLLIHLLSRSRGQRVLVGNIELFRRVQRQRASQLRLVQWLLLALRALMIVVAALLLADLARQGLGPPVEGIAYVTPARLAAAERGDVPIDKEYQQLVTLQGGWSQLAEALAIQRHQGVVPVYTLASANDQPGRPLALPSPVTWHSDGMAEPRQASRLDVLIAHEPQRFVEAQAIRLALESAAAFSKLVVNVRLTLTEAVGPGDIDQAEETALIWLGDTPVPTTAQAGVVFRDSAGDAGSAARFTTIQAWPGLGFLATGKAANEPSSSEVVWRDAAGQALLIEQRVAGQRQIRLTQRLALDGNGPMAQDGWPGMLARLLLGEAAWQSATAFAALPDGQSPPALPVLTRGQPARSLVPLLSLLLAVLFLAERWLSERPGKSTKTDG